MKPLFLTYKGSESHALASLLELAANGQMELQTLERSDHKGGKVYQPFQYHVTGIRDHDLPQTLLRITPNSVEEITLADFIRETIIFPSIALRKAQDEVEAKEIEAIDSLQD